MLGSNKCELTLTPVQVRQGGNGTRHPISPGGIHSDCNANGHNRHYPMAADRASNADPCLGGPVVARKSWRNYTFGDWRRLFGTFSGRWEGEGDCLTRTVDPESSGGNIQPSGAIVNCDRGSPDSWSSAPDIGYTGGVSETSARTSSGVEDPTVGIAEVDCGTDDRNREMRRIQGQVAELTARHSKMIDALYGTAEHRQEQLRQIQKHLKQT